MDWVYVRAWTLATHRRCGGRSAMAPLLQLWLARQGWAHERGNTSLISNKHGWICNFRTNVFFLFVVKRHRFPWNGCVRTTASVLDGCARGNEVAAWPSCIGEEFVVVSLGHEGREVVVLREPLLAGRCSRSRGANAPNQNIWAYLAHGLGLDGPMNRIISVGGNDLGHPEPLFHTYSG
jgi:hypothetical protein